ncbi:ArsR/SmtB family transcription factor [Streptomyces sp. NPDC002537]
MLRIHFTGEDLARTRIATGPDVLWEILLSLHMAQSGVTGPGAVDFLRWRGAVRQRLTAEMPRRAVLLGKLAPPSGYSADFLTPTTGVADVESALGTVLATPRRQLHRDITRLAAARGPVDGGLARLAAGDTESLAALGNALRAYHRLALAPYWRHMTRQIAADRAERMAALAEGGTERLLLGLHPAARWEPPVLSLAYPVSQDLFLDGRGMTLLPSFFCWGTPIMLREPGTVPALVYPIGRRARWMDGGPDGPPVPAPLVTLVGRTRAQVLYEVIHGCGTGELARRVGISNASASQHATVLRHAGLIVTRRSGNTVHHSPTALGRALLDGG